MTSRADAVLAAIGNRRAARSGWVRANCPFCVLSTGKDDRSQALGLNTATGGWHCFRCGESGRVPTDGFARPKASPIPVDAELQTLPQGFVPLGTEPGLSALSTLHIRSYLDRRGIRRHVWREAGIGCALSGRWAHRAIVPVRRPDASLVGWVARHVGENPMRYLNSSGAIPGLFNEGALYVETNTPVMVVEGVFDALPFWPDAVALLGKPKDMQLAMLLDACRPVAVVLDGDAWREAEALAWRLKFEGKRAGFVRLPPTRDPADCQDGLSAQVMQCVS